MDFTGWNMKLWTEYSERVVLAFGDRAASNLGWLYDNHCFSIFCKSETAACDLDVCVPEWHGRRARAVHMKDSGLQSLETTRSLRVTVECNRDFLSVS
jgi:hypothetical protein